MLRTTAPGHASNLYTEGNATLGVPATVVSAEAANFWQEELCNLVEGAGLTLASDDDQVLEAVQIIAGLGGAQVSFAIANNQAVAANVTGLLLVEADTKAARIEYSIDRHTASSNLQQVGVLSIIHDVTDDVWRIEDTSSFDDCGVVFSITSGGQVQYTSTNLAGASYGGEMIATITKLNL